MTKKEKIDKLEKLKKQIKFELRMINTNNVLYNSIINVHEKHKVNMKKFYENANEYSVKPYSDDKLD